jgi:chromosome segregation protein
VRQISEAKAGVEEARKQLESEWEQLRLRCAQLEDELRQGRHRLDALRDEHSQKDLDRVRLDSERSHLEETCRMELGVPPGEIFLAEERVLSTEALAQAEQTYREMREKLEAMGPVNMMALEEYQETEQRHRFLSEQRDDLVASINDTTQAIGEIDDVSRKQFLEAFESINRYFNETFRTLFGGGTGAMRLTDELNLAESGLDIVAQPPGKKLQNVLLLSGGEKALTALALLLAIFRFQPSPFCILDEVDAPLDEANVGRFTAMILEMARHTQFILITHNKKTMEMAPVLYGVTMQEPGISKLVSVKFGEQAKAAAA